MGSQSHRAPIGNPPPPAPPQAGHPSVSASHKNFQGRAQEVQLQGPTGARTRAHRVRTAPPEGNRAAPSGRRKHPCTGLGHPTQWPALHRGSRCRQKRFPRPALSARFPLLGGLSAIFPWLTFGFSPGNLEISFGLVTHPLTQ